MVDVTQRPIATFWKVDATNEVLDVRVVSNKIKDGYYVGLSATNINTTDVFVQFFDKKAEDVDLGVTDKPKHVVVIPAGDGTKRGGHDHEAPGPIWHKNSVAFAVTTTAEGNTAPASDIEITIYTRS